MALAAPPAGPPVIAGDTIVVPLQAGGVIALVASDATARWKAELTAAWPISADLERTYIAAGGAMQALRLDTGQVAWRTETGALTAPPLVHSGWIILATAGSLSAFRATDGSTVWRRNIGAVQFRPAIDGDLLFVPLVEGSVACLDLRNGEPRWQRRLGGAPGEPLAVGGKVFAGASDKFFYVLDASDGEIQWRPRVGASPLGRPAADIDHVYLVAFDNVLRAMDRGHGGIEWTEGLKYRPVAGAVLVSDAIVVPGAVTRLPVFRRDGGALTGITLTSPLVALSNVVQEESGRPVLALVTGDLENPWTLWVFEASTDPPPISIVDLTVLPGVTIAIAMPQ